MFTRTFFIIVAAAVCLSAGTAQPCSAQDRQDRVDMITTLRLSQLRSGGMALLPVRLTLTLPPGVDIPRFRLQKHIEESVAAALTKFHHDFQVVPPETTSAILGTSVLGVTGRVPAFMQGDSLVLSKEASTLIRKRTGVRFIMAMSLVDRMPSALQKTDAGRDADAIMVACRIWDTETGNVVWEVRHPWSIPAASDTLRMKSAMRRLCTDILAKIPQ